MRVTGAVGEFLELAGTRCAGLRAESRHHLGQRGDGRVHTNTTESFWALLKRCINGT